MEKPDARGKPAASLLAVEDTEFLLRDEMRAIRFALEYAKAELLLRDRGIRSTVIVFGSSRLAGRGGEGPRDGGDRGGEEGAARLKRQAGYYQTSPTRPRRAGRSLSGAASRPILPTRVRS